MEGGVKDGNLRDFVAQSGLAGVDADDVGRIVEGGQGVAGLDGLHDLVVDEDGGGKGFAAVDDAVAHCVDLAHGGDDAVGRVYQGVEHGLDGLGVGGHGDVDGVQLGLAGQLGLIGELAVDTDALAQAFGQQVAGGGVQQLILQRGAACVDNQNVHTEISPFFIFSSVNLLTACGGKRRLL